MKQLLLAIFPRFWRYRTKNRLVKVPLGQIIDRKVRYDKTPSDSESSNSIVSSFVKYGQLQPICLRRHPANKSKYEVIFGSRRFAAAKKLGWHDISALVTEADDADSLIMTLVENEDREDFTDYERALLIERIRSVTKRSYMDVAALIGKSPAFVSQHVAMLHLFPESIASPEEIKKVLCALTEGHARALLKVEDTQERWASAKLAVKANLSVRELEKHCKGIVEKKGERSMQRKEIVSIISKIIAGLNSKDLTPLYQARFKHGFSLFSRFPPFDKLKDQDANEHIFKALTHMNLFRITLRDIDLICRKGTAIAIMNLTYEIGMNSKVVSTITRATLVFLKEEGRWGIIHEHWSGTGEGVTISIR
jgi:ParB family transcriptional regulator, chromosome partitioning protein